MSDTFLLAGGGTAGHVNPLVATAHELRNRGHQVLAVGSVGGLEEELVPKAGIELTYISRVPFPRRMTGEALRFPARFREAVAQSRAIIEELRPRAVVGFGGYVSTPVYVAARRAKVPIVVHEANAHPGLANKMGARWAARVAVSYPETPLPKAEVTGVPLSPDIVTLARTLSGTSAPQTRMDAKKKHGWAPDQPAALVMGGSLGAARINEAIVGAVESLTGHGIAVYHLTGRDKSADATVAYGNLPAKARHLYVVAEYSHAMAEVYAACDVVVCRAGAGTVAEVSALNIPALYVPLPIGNGEQVRNAAPPVDAGAAVMIEDRVITAHSVGAEIERMLLDEEVYSAMRHAAGNVGYPHATATLADMVEEVAQ